MQPTYEEPRREGAPSAKEDVSAASAAAAARYPEPRTERAWLSSLMRELFQTECSAKTHPRIEAERLGDVPPASAMRAVADHADAAFSDLPRLARKHGLPISRGGEGVGKAFSMLREALGDLLLSIERSYRGTILGMRHGIDLVVLIREVAKLEGETELVEWCSTWLDRRRPLVEAAAEQLSWFASHPARANDPAKTGPLASGMHALMRGFEELAEKLRQKAARSS